MKKKQQKIAKTSKKKTSKMSAQLNKFNNNNN
jgi:hypothetical protein